MCWKNRHAFWNSNKAKQDMLQKCCMQKYTIKTWKLAKTKSYIMIKTVFNKIRIKNLGMFISYCIRKLFLLNNTILNHVL